MTATSASSAITTHVLDTARGKPASGIPVSLARRSGDAWDELGRGVTDADGRLRTLLDGKTLESGTYRIRFETGGYFAARGESSFYPHVEIAFDVRDPSQHYHVPVLLSPFGFTTYLGS